MAGPTGDDPGDLESPIDPRFTLANERTFLAWIRTGLALVVAGLAVTQFFRPFSIAAGRRILGVPLIAVGAAVSLWCFRRWIETERAMRRGEIVPATTFPAFVTIVVGVVALTGLVFVLFWPGA